MSSETPYYLLQCRFGTQSGSIERLLRVIRVRGFAVKGLRLEYIDACYNANIAVSGKRSIENLTWHLSKLAEVSTIFVADAPSRTLEHCA